MQLRCFSGWMLALALGAFAPSAAQADVLEIGDKGAVWVAGGPRVAAALQAAAPNAPHETQMVANAGPAYWQARVAQHAARNDLSPALLEAVVWQESRWNPNAVSGKGARGLAQLMPATARQLGVDAADPDANLAGGARYLRLQLDNFGGDIEKALAAYNAGPGRVQRAGKVPAIRETQDYVAQVMARLAANLRN